jgi:hypothetical protein
MFTRTFQYLLACNEVTAAPSSRPEGAGEVLTTSPGALPPGRRARDIPFWMGVTRAGVLNSLSPRGGM